MKENEGQVDYDVLRKKHTSIIRKGDFTKLKDEEVGSQLTLIHHQLWNRITPSDFFHFAQDHQQLSNSEEEGSQTATAKIMYLSKAIERWIELEFSCKDMDDATVFVKLLNIAEVRRAL